MEEREGEQRGVYGREKKGKLVYGGKKKKEKEEEEQELRNLKGETEVWRYINKRRGRKEGMENNIRKKEWKRHFMKLLEGMEKEERDEKKEEKRYGNREERRKEEVVEENRALRKQKIRRAMKNMKKKKAAGIDEILMEAWMFGGEAVLKSLLDIMNQMKEEKIPEEWRISVIVPIYKKGDQEKAENYRGVSLLCTGYKIICRDTERKVRGGNNKEEIITRKSRRLQKGQRSNG